MKITYKTRRLFKDQNWLSWTPEKKYQSKIRQHIPGLINEIFQDMLKGYDFDLLDGYKYEIKIKYPELNREYYYSVNIIMKPFISSIKINENRIKEKL